MPSSGETAPLNTNRLATGFSMFWRILVGFLALAIVAVLWGVDSPAELKAFIKASGFMAVVGIVLWNIPAVVLTVVHALGVRIDDTLKMSAKRLGWLIIGITAAYLLDRW